MISHLKITSALIKRKRPDFEFRVFHDSPVTPLSRPLNECKVALITTGGLHLRTDRPFDMDMKDGDPSYRVVPGDVRHADLGISHKWYNHKFINADLDCVFPVNRMREYAENGRIGSVSEEHYSFMGHIYYTDRLEKNSEELGRRVKKLGVDVVLLTPA
ncbi:MAG: glycine/betaine/sarcosine/D-proline family reductase selenoprotein B [Nitrospirota bacterium]|nr:glycine/betaine/sarcosine/D-proline family reductase selenoprotein B [Nitrospirota bacterium]